MRERRIGVYICHCGENIGGKIDVERVRDFVSELDNVCVARDYRFVCSDPGQKMIEDDINEHDLTHVVVAACSPTLHEKTFQETVEKAGLNPFKFQQANIREHCSWVTADKTQATEKAVKQVKAAVRRVGSQVPLDVKQVEVVPRLLVIGAGITGITAALDAANGGKEVVLVERQPTIGGHMAMLDKTFPTMDCSSCILTPKMSEVGHHPHIELLTYSEVDSVDGFPGNYEVTIRKKARGVDVDDCTGCNACSEVCPAPASDEFNQGLSPRKAIFTPFAQAVPNAYAIDWDACVGCQLCEVVCKEEGPDCVDLEAEDELVEQSFGEIIVATGYELMDPSKVKDYGYGKYDNVLTGLELERMCDATGPTGGKILCADDEPPESVAFVLCVGSRDKNYHEYCSQVCCMYSMKQALLLREKIGEHIPLSIFFTDIRAAGKRFEEFYNKVRGEKIEFVRGRPSAIYKTPEGNLLVKAQDTLLGEEIEQEFDMVVLAPAIEPNPHTDPVARELTLSKSEDGFLLEKHPKLAPLNTTSDAVFVAGACQGPRDVSDSVSQGSGAAAQAVASIDKGYLALEPYLTEIDEDVCCGCKTCVTVCPFDAARFDSEREVVRIDETLCKGCGVCVASCPTGAANQRGFTDEQLELEYSATIEELVHG